MSSASLKIRKLATKNRIILTFLKKFSYIVSNCHEIILTLIILTFMKIEPEILVNIVNDCLVQGKCPDSWKYTVVTPIPKVKNSIKASDKRPINKAPTLDKILQTIVKLQLEEHIQENNLLSMYQSAFREKHSCETSLNFVLNQWKQIKAEKRKIVAIFIDLRRAFETIDRSILIDVLKSFNITGTVLNWFTSWLTNRVQYTCFCGVMSNEMNIDLGVPQGTPLSCPLFNVYINEIVDYVLHCKLNLFADDALLWIDAETMEEALVKITCDFKNVIRFLCMRKLSLNLEKTKLRIIGDQDSEIENIQIDNNIIILNV